MRSRVKKNRASEKGGSFQTYDSISTIEHAERIIINFFIFKIAKFILCICTNIYMFITYFISVLNFISERIRKTDICEGGQVFKHMLSFLAYQVIENLLIYFSQLLMYRIFKNMKLHF